MVAAKTLYVTASRNPATQCILGVVVPCSSGPGLGGKPRPECAVPAAPGRCPRGVALTLLRSRTSTNRPLRSAAGEQWRLRGPCTPAHTSQGRVHKDDARWAGEALTSSAALRGPSGGDVSTLGHRARTTFIILRTPPCSELPASLPRVTPRPATRGPRSKSWNSGAPGHLPRRPRGGAATRPTDL